MRTTELGQSKVEIAVTAHCYWGGSSQLHLCSFARDLRFASDGLVIAAGSGTTENRHYFKSCHFAKNFDAELLISNIPNANFIQAVGGAYRENGTDGIGVADATSANPLKFVGNINMTGNMTAVPRYDGANSSAASGALTALSAPSSTTVFTKPFLVQVIVFGGTVTHIQVYGTTIV